GGVVGGRGLVLPGLLQGGGAPPQRVAPRGEGRGGRPRPRGQGPDTGVGRQGQEDSGPPDQPLVGRLPPLQAFQQGLLHRGNNNSSGSRSRHSSTRSTNLGAMNLETMLRIAELTG